MNVMALGPMDDRRFLSLPIVFATLLFAILPLDIAVPAVNLSFMALAKYCLPRLVDLIRDILDRRQHAEWLTIDLTHPVG
jgi:hypothetical protein